MGFDVIAGSVMPRFSTTMSIVLIVWTYKWLTPLGNLTSHRFLYLKLSYAVELLAGNPPTSEMLFKPVLVPFTTTSIMRSSPEHRNDILTVLNDMPARSTVVV